MPSIHILPDRVANQIAAGEVVERPAAVVKELVENSLDAGATRITVEFRHGGRSLIAVEDNGAGMDRDDALLALERHATSKIREAADLDRLVTFGFRGEALPSIASVSRFELRTRRAGSAAGTELAVNGGKFLHVRDCGLAAGTHIAVTNLFNSVPARRKFLKSDSTEAAHIIQCVRFYALANPGVAFALVEDGRPIFQSPPCTSLLERVTEIFGRQIAEALLPVEAGNGPLRLSGLIGRPGASRSSRHEMITFVNRRPVETRTLAYALIESYQTSLPKGRYPLAFLFLELDPAQVDVNVHPAKREVRFRNEPAIRTFLVQALLEALRAAAGGHEKMNTQSGPAAPRPVPVDPLLDDTPARAGPPPLPSLVLPLRPGAEPRPGGAVLRGVPAAAKPADGPVTVAGGRGMSGWRHLGLAHGDLEVFETPGGVALLDRRAALERILFEDLQEEFRAGRTASQRLLFAVPVELDPVAAAMLADQLAFLEKHGLAVSVFGRNFFRIEAVPVWLDPAEGETFLRDIVSRLRDGRIDPRKEDLAREELARLAAARAVRGARRADTGDELAARLLACRQPLVTPGGEPTLVEVSRAELARRFQKDRC